MQKIQQEQAQTGHLENPKTLDDPAQAIQVREADEVEDQRQAKVSIVGPEHPAVYEHIK